MPAVGLKPRDTVEVCLGLYILTIALQVEAIYAEVMFRSGV